VASARRRLIGRAHRAPLMHKPALNKTASLVNQPVVAVVSAQADELTWKPYDDIRPGLGRGSERTAGLTGKHPGAGAKADVKLRSQPVRTIPRPGRAPSRSTGRAMSGDHSSLPNLDSPPFAFHSGRAWSPEDRPLQAFGRAPPETLGGLGQHRAKMLKERAAESAGAPCGCTSVGSCRQCQLLCCQQQALSQ